MAYQCDFLIREKDELTHLQRLTTDFKYFFFHICVEQMYGDKNIWKPSRGFEIMSEYCVALLEGEIKRLAISIPPRMGKSQLFSTALPMFEWLSKPEGKFISVAHHEDLLKQFAGDRKLIFNHLDYQRCIDWVLETSTVDTMRNSGSGHCLSMTSEHIVTGLGGDCILVDDPIPAAKARSLTHCDKIWSNYTGALYSRLNDKKSGKIGVISQRVSEADIIGRVTDIGYTTLVLQAISDEPTTLIFPLSGKTWEREKGDVLNPDLEPLEVLLEMKAQDEFTFQAQYQQKPLVDGGGLINIKQLRTYDKPQEIYKEIIISVDSAASVSSKSANWGITVFGNYIDNGISCLDLLYCHAKKYEYPEGLAKVKEIGGLYGVSWYFVENRSTGLAIIPTLINEGKRVESIEAVRSKEDRFLSAVPYINSGRFRVPNTDNLPFTEGWLINFKYELLGWPHAKTRDLVDSTTQVINYYLGHNLNIKAFYRLG